MGGKILPEVGSDKRSALDLGVILVEQLRQPISVLKRGLLKDASLFNGAQLCQERRAEMVLLAEELGEAQSIVDQTDYGDFTLPLRITL